MSRFHGKLRACGSQAFCANNHLGFRTVTERATVEAITANKILRAPFQKVAPPVLFPWRHEEQPLARLIPGTADFEEKGTILGGYIWSRNPSLEAVAIAYLLLNVPFYQLLFFRDWKAELADSFSWAFTQGVSGILSNAYHGKCYARVALRFPIFLSTKASPHDSAF